MGKKKLRRDEALLARCKRATTTHPGATGFNSWHTAPNQILNIKHGWHSRGAIAVRLALLSVGASDTTLAFPANEGMPGVSRAPSGMFWLRSCHSCFWFRLAQYLSVVGATLTNGTDRGQRRDTQYASRAQLVAERVTLVSH